MQTLNASHAAFILYYPLELLKILLCMFVCEYVCVVWEDTKHSKLFEDCPYQNTFDMKFLRV